MGRLSVYNIDCSHDGAGGHPVVHDLVHEEGGLHGDDALASHVLRPALSRPPPLQHVVKILNTDNYCGSHPLSSAVEDISVPVDI